MITILAFNYGKAGIVHNGPGLSLLNLKRILSKSYNIQVFTELKSTENSLKDIQLAFNSISNSDIVIHWSGISNETKALMEYAASKKKLTFLGPNLIDTVNLDIEKKYLNKLKGQILTTNTKLQYLINKAHNRLPKILQVGPDINKWIIEEEKTYDILWKGNSTHTVKDVQFGLELSKQLRKYQFKFIGYPKLYDYEQHIQEAKRARLYISTSLSETLGLTLIEQWSAGIPSITHPEIFGIQTNYKTGIITSRTIEHYKQAISEILEDKLLYDNLSASAKKYAIDNFSDDVILERFNQLCS